MELIQGTLAGSKTVLAHFHYCLKGQFSFALDEELTIEAKTPEPKKGEEIFLKVVVREINKKRYAEYLQ